MLHLCEHGSRINGLLLVGELVKAVGGSDSHEASLRVPGWRVGQQRRFEVSTLTYT